jgi:hypothetical protein
MVHVLNRLRGQILSPWLVDIIDSGIELSYRPAWRAGIPQPYVIIDYIPQSGSKNLASGFRKKQNNNERVQYVFIVSYCT